MSPPASQPVNPCGNSSTAPESTDSDPAPIHLLPRPAPATAAPPGRRDPVAAAPSEFRPPEERDTSPPAWGSNSRDTPATRPHILASRSPGAPPRSLPAPCPSYETQISV